MLRKHQMSQEEQCVFLNAFNSIFFGMGIKDLWYIREVKFLLGSAYLDIIYSMERKEKRDTLFLVLENGQ